MCNICSCIKLGRRWDSWTVVMYFVGVATSKLINWSQYLVLMPDPLQSAWWTAPAIHILHFAVEWLPPHDDGCCRFFMQNPPIHYVCVTLTAKNTHLNAVWVNWVLGNVNSLRQSAISMTRRSAVVEKPRDAPYYLKILLITYAMSAGVDRTLETVCLLVCLFVRSITQKRMIPKCSN